MSSGKFLLIALSFTILIAETAQVQASGISCPRRYEGKRLAHVSLFDGPPSDRADLISQRGEYYHLDDPKSRFSSYFSLGCSYDGLDTVVPVVLPRYIRMCKFTGGPQVLCR